MCLFVCVCACSRARMSLVFAFGFSRTFSRCALFSPLSLQEAFLEATLTESHLPENLVLLEPTELPSVVAGSKLPNVEVLPFLSPFPFSFWNVLSSSFPISPDCQLSAPFLWVLCAFVVL